MADIQPTIPRSMRDTRDDIERHFLDQSAQFIINPKQNDPLSSKKR
jgi:hypothetical protein